MHALLRDDVNSVPPQVESRVESKSSPAASMGPTAVISANVDATLGAAGSVCRNDDRVGVALGATANRGHMQPVGVLGMRKPIEP